MERTDESLRKLLYSRYDCLISRSSSWPVSSMKDGDCSVEEDGSMSKRPIRGDDENLETESSTSLLKFIREIECMDVAKNQKESKETQRKDDGNLGLSFCVGHDSRGISGDDTHARSSSITITVDATTSCPVQNDCGSTTIRNGIFGMKKRIPPRGCDHTKDKYEQKELCSSTNNDNSSQKVPAHNYVNSTSSPYIASSRRIVTFSPAMKSLPIEIEVSSCENNQHYKKHEEDYDSSFDNSSNAMDGSDAQLSLNSRSPGGTSRTSIGDKSVTFSVPILPKKVEWSEDEEDSNEEPRTVQQNPVIRFSSSSKSRRYNLKGNHRCCRRDKTQSMSRLQPVSFSINCLPREVELNIDDEDSLVLDEDLFFHSKSNSGKNGSSGTCTTLSSSWNSSFLLKGSTKDENKFVTTTSEERIQSLSASSKTRLLPREIELLLEDSVSTPTINSTC